MPRKKRERRKSGDRKHGRNREKCHRYFQTRRRIENKVKRFIKNNLSPKLTEAQRRAKVQGFENFQEKRRQRRLSRRPNKTNL